jgi:N4-gp56 family major capsid protein
MATAKLGVLTDEQRTFYELKMLARALAPTVHLYLGQVGIHPPTMLPEHKGYTISWNKMSALTSTTTALTEGITPASEDITITATTGTVAEYGAYVKYTAWLARLGIDMVANEAADALGEQAADSLDLLVRNTLVAGGTAQYADDATDTDEVEAGDYFSAAEAMEGLATLKTAKAVAPMNGFYPCVIHPYTEYDLYQDSVFQSILAYSKERGEGNAWITGYVGRAFGMEFFVSPNAYVESSAGAGSIDVYHTLVIGKSAFGIGGLAAYMPKVAAAGTNENNTFKKLRPLRLIEKPFGSAGSADPLDQRATIAWYTTFVVKVLEAAFMMRIEHDVRLG